MQGAAAWVTVRCWPARVSVPVRGDEDELADAVKTTSADPVPPLDPMASHGAEASAEVVQGQTPAVATVTAPAPPAYGIAAESDDSL